MFRSLILILALAQLTACAQLATPAQTMPTTPQIALTHYPNRDQQYIKQIIQPINKIIAYFDENENRINEPVEYGFYRVHIGNTKNGDAIIQDFYQKTKTKQTDALKISPQALYEFNLYKNQSIHNTYYYKYYPNGNILSISYLKNRLPSQFTYYKNNQIIFSGEMQFDPNPQPIYSKVKYVDGISIETFFTPDKIERHWFDEQGKRYFSNIKYLKLILIEQLAYHENGQILSRQIESSAYNEYKILDEQGYEIWDFNQDDIFNKNNPKNNDKFKQYLSKLVKLRFKSQEAEELLKLENLIQY